MATAKISCDSKESVGNSLPGRWHVTDISELTAAIENTTDTISLSLLHSNRSAAHLSGNFIDKAIHDAQEAIKFSPTASEGHVQLGLALEKNSDNIGACEVYMNALKRFAEPRKDLVDGLIRANDRCQHFGQHMITGVKLLGCNFCTVCQSTGDVLQCSRCKYVYYCGKAHQKEDWKHHKGVCKVIPEILKEQKQISSHSLPRNIIDAVKLKTPFSSVNIDSWDDVFAKLVLLVDKKYMSEFLSWPLNMIAAARKFDLIKKSKLCIHVVGADDWECFHHLFDQCLALFPIPDMDICLIGPELSSNFGPVITQSSSRSVISLKGIRDHYHTYTEHAEYRVPDMIYGCHPGFFDGTYPWRPTIFRLVKNAIPCAFTAWSKDDHVKDLALLNSNADIVEAKMMFKGKTPFPSMHRQLRRNDSFHYEVLKMNSYWLGFHGGKVLGREQAEDMFKVLDDIKGLGGEEIRRFKASLMDQMF